jgi:hypothetical protein
MIELDTGPLRVSTWMRRMWLAILPAVVFVMSASAMADAIYIVSPDHAQTFAYGQTTWRQLYLDRAAGELGARITFSNLPYAGDDEPRRDESFSFRFPGVQFDSARRAFFVNGRHGEQIPVARFRDPAFGWIDLLPEAKIYLVKESGRVTATLTATSYPRTGIRWVETDNNFSLQNVLTAFFRDFHLQPDN